MATFINAPELFIFIMGVSRIVSSLGKLKIFLKSRKEKKVIKRKIFIFGSSSNTSTFFFFYVFPYFFNFKFKIVFLFLNSFLSKKNKINV